MQAQHPSSSKHKAITPQKGGSSTFMPSRRLLATAAIGAALIAYQVHKTQDARQRLESLANTAQSIGDLTDRDAAVVAKFLAKPATLPLTQGEPRYVF